MSLSSQVFAHQHRPWCHVSFVKMRAWSVKSRYLKDTILNFISIICINYTRSYDIQSFYYPDVGVIFDKFILSSSDKLADAYPTGTLYSRSGTQNEQKNTQNNVIEVEIRTLTT